MIWKLFFGIFIILFKYSFASFCASKRIGIDNVTAFPDSAFSHFKNYITGPAVARLTSGSTAWLGFTQSDSWVQVDLRKFKVCNEIIIYLSFLLSSTIRYLRNGFERRRCQQTYIFIRRDVW